MKFIELLARGCGGPATSWKQLFSESAGPARQRAHSFTEKHKLEPQAGPSPSPSRNQRDGRHDPESINKQLRTGRPGNWVSPRTWGLSLYSMPSRLKRCRGWDLETKAIERPQDSLLCG